MKIDNNAMLEELYQKVFSFLAGSRINSPEDIYQHDWVLSNALDFIEDLFTIIEDRLPKTIYED